MRIMIVSDAWHPQVNGVVTTLDTVSQGLRARGHEVAMLTHEGFRTIGVPTYREIRLALVGQETVGRRIHEFAPDSIHIATEGTLGWRARAHCLKNGLAFTTSFHSRFPEYVAGRIPIPGLERLLYAVLKRFHAPASAVLAPTPTVTARLAQSGFSHVITWTRGVDHDAFQPMDSDVFSGLPRPVHINVGRIAPEKNLKAFLDLDLPGTKVVVGDGPQMAALKAAHADVVFTGYKKGLELARLLSAADVFVFPSRTDTFGLVMIEAMACGTPVAAYPVEGPIDVVTDPKAGALDDDLSAAIRRALQCRREDCIAFARTFTWSRVVDEFEASLVPVRNGNSGQTTEMSGASTAFMPTV